MQEDVEEEEEAVTFFEPSSPYYLATMYATLAGLAVFLCCGILYQTLCYKNVYGISSKSSRDLNNELYPLKRLVIDLICVNLF